MRTDNYSPSTINPSELQYVGIWYDPSAASVVGGDMLMAAERETIARFMDEHGARWASHSHGGTCMCCGASAAYLAVFYHEHHGECIRVGQECASKLHMGCDGDFRAARAKVSKAKDTTSAETRAQLQLQEAGLSGAWNVYKTAGVSDSDESIVRDMVRNLVRFGSLSTKQLEFLKRLIYRIENRAALEAQRAAEKAQAQDCPTGRMEITGTVLSTKEVEGHYGTALKMFVKTPEGYTLWGTVPKGLAVERGAEVSFRATVEPSKDDPKHGYFSRPSAQSSAQSSAQKD